MKESHFPPKKMPGTDNFAERNYQIFKEIALISNFPENYRLVSVISILLKKL